jgi:hypothetical protein
VETPSESSKEVEDRLGVPSESSEEGEETCQKEPPPEIPFATAMPASPIFAAGRKEIEGFS